MPPSAADASVGSGAKNCAGAALNCDNASRLSSLQPAVSKFAFCSMSRSSMSERPGCTRTKKRPSEPRRMPSTRFMRDAFSTQPPWGTAPAAKPERAPCTVTGTPVACRACNASRTSASDSENTILSAEPTLRDSSRRYSSNSSVQDTIPAIGSPFGALFSFLQECSP